MWLWFFEVVAEPCFLELFDGDVFLIPGAEVGFLVALLSGAPGALVNLLTNNHLITLPELVPMMGGVDHIHMAAFLAGYN